MKRVESGGEFPREMLPRSVRVYVALTVLVALAVLAVQDWSALLDLSRDAAIGFGALIFLAILSEVTSAFSYSVGPAGGKHSLVFLPLVAAVVLFGPVPAVLLILLTGLAAEFGVRRKPPLRALFNTAQYVNATAVGGFLFGQTGGYPLAGAAPAGSFDAQLLPMLVFGGSLLLLNHVAVALAIALSEGAPWFRLTRSLLNRIAGTVISDLMVLPVAILVAFLYFELWVGGLFVAVLPLLFVRYSYLAKFRLEAANRDLLRVLVKAIETRDANTSGHSIRVQSLAKRIGEEIGLNIRQADELETAALLHDIGKIELVYQSILQKPSALSDQEHAVIQSHVGRGVEILTSLSSFNSRIIDGIRSHHELYDGTGYPEGLAGEQIPLYARIIKVSDAIDAMLSNRPYRNALPVESVRSELQSYAGRQFDPTLVDAVLRSNILSEHSTFVELERLTAQPVARAGHEVRQGATAYVHH